MSVVDARPGSPLRLVPAEGPLLAAAVQLLRAAELPVDDLADPCVQLTAALQGDTVVGVVGLQRCDGVGLLRSLTVTTDQRGRGVAQTLCAHVRAVARQQRMTSLYLLTTGAADYFARLGFSPVERDAVPEGIRNSAQFTSLCPSTARVMRLALD